MTKTTITQPQPGYVTLQYDGGVEGLITRQFMVPRSGGFVREMRSGDWKQVCAGLSRTGPTLTATPETLLALIRKEWRVYRLAMA